MIRITNDFHGTETHIRAVPGQPISARTTRRVRRALCGMADCQCGGPLGERGPQFLGDGSRVIARELPGRRAVILPAPY